MNIDILGSLLQLESLRSIDLSKNPALLQDPDVTKTFKTNLPWTSVRLSGTVTRLRISNQKFINAIIISQSAILRQNFKTFGTPLFPEV